MNLEYKKIRDRHRVNKMDPWDVKEEVEESKCS